MFVRNFLSSGDYVEIVPIGLLTTIQYSQKGTIEKIYLNHDDNELVDVTDTFLSNILELHIVPNTIPIKDGTTYIKGVLYSSEVNTDCGDIPDSSVERLSVKFVEHPEQFEFFAGYVKSFARAFHSSIDNRQWLTFAKFNVLPGAMMPATIQDEQAWFKSICVNNTYTFKYPYISNVIVFKQGEPSTISTELRQYKVEDIEIYEEVSGNIAAKLKFNGDTFDISISMLDRLKIGEGSYILVDDEMNIINVYNGSQTSPYIINHTTSCITCGAPITIDPNALTTTCSDSHCPSKMFNRFRHFCKMLGLPVEIPREDLDKMVGESVVEHQTLTFGRLLDCDMFNNIQLHTSIYNVLRAIIPGIIISDSNTSIIDKICAECNNSLSTLEYILSHIDKFVETLNLSPKQVDWFKDEDNVIDIMSVLRHPVVEIDETYRRFDGPPIFRDKTILVTGTFLHGAYNEISSILQSYGAVVTDVYDAAKKFDCVVIGSTHENVNGAYIKAANKQGVPVFEEQSFFERYDIDTDIMNL